MVACQSPPGQFRYFSESGGQVSPSFDGTASGTTLVARAPGRINLIGDHTDYNGGLALPMAIDLSLQMRWKTAESSRALALRSSMEPDRTLIHLDHPTDPLDIEPRWARYIAAVAEILEPSVGGFIDITASLPVGAGLSSSAAMCVACSLLFAGSRNTRSRLDDPVELARLCQRAESKAGIDVGIMDPLVIMLGRRGHALLIDFTAISWRLVPIPAGVDVFIADSGERRTLRDSPYKERRAQCEQAAAILGPLPQARLSDLRAIGSDVLRKRARHVITECDRVRAASHALASSDMREMGELMNESHRSMAVDFDASTSALDELAESLQRRDGVYGARLTGGGFGGCVVALCQTGALEPDNWPGRAWKVVPAEGATIHAGTV